MMKPRDSIASTASHGMREASSASCSVTALNATGFASTGVMSLNTMPGFGKSGTSTISDLISSGLIAGRKAPLPKCALHSSKPFPPMTFSQACVKTAVRGLNLGGRTLRRLGVERPALDADSLHRAAYRRAGVSRYGEWDFAEPLERLLKSYRDEAALTTLGRITVRELVVSLLDNLL